MKNLGKAFAVFTLIIGIAVASCDSNEGSTGTLKLSLTDAPLDNPDIVAVNLSVVRVDIKGNDGWEVLDDFEDPVDVNLLNYRDGNSFLLTEEELPAGGYKEIRLVLDIAEHDGGDAANRGTYLEFSDGTREPLFVPSGEQSGYKAKGNFTIPPDGIVGITLDIDARRAVVEAGNSGKFLLKPVVRLVEDKDVAMIKGSITSETAYESLKVFAYEEGSYTEDELIVEPESVEFPNSITSGNVSEDGAFTLGFINSGTYDLVVALYDENQEFVEVVAIIEDVSVDPGQILSLPVVLP
ncbi:DUF4382 domain-containing protein [Fulvivirga sedimenti]|uniref:DUF4382 domain-containing protein n=1 Tax=Fulvivirga sedimenti TaxID=2879465 RepID=A0A9X1HVL7_9BACT|nr:DUF4382 domain-containing protein [Fulvivirga sedimenti]MCA6078175.1 DUF4382 domain-containing protein [Fulvivirga sedimenti]